MPESNGFDKERSAQGGIALTGILATQDALLGLSAAALTDAKTTMSLIGAAGRISGPMGVAATATYGLAVGYKNTGTLSGAVKQATVDAAYTYAGVRAAAITFSAMTASPSSWSPYGLAVAVVGSIGVGAGVAIYGPQVVDNLLSFDEAKPDPKLNAIIGPGAALSPMMTGEPRFPGKLQDDTDLAKVTKTPNVAGISPNGLRSESTEAAKVGRVDGISPTGIRSESTLAARAAEAARLDGLAKSTNVSGAYGYRSESAMAEAGRRAGLPGGSVGGPTGSRSGSGYVAGEGGSPYGGGGGSSGSKSGSAKSGGSSDGAKRDNQDTAGYGGGFGRSSADSYSRGGGYPDADRGMGGSGIGSQPVILDLDGNGIAIQTLGQSDEFVDIDGNGFLHRTAWADGGDGVLVFDADGDGKISRSKEYVFTEWNSSAEGDLVALRNIFDTNGNGALDSGDAQWSSFKVSVDGVLHGLSDLGIASIDLTPKGGQRNFGDGSAILGTTEFTRTDGSTGTVADAVLAHDSTAYKVDRGLITNGDGSTVETIWAHYQEGGAAFRNIITTSADGNSILTEFDDDANGTIDRSQSKIVSIAGDGARTRTVTNFAADGSVVDQIAYSSSADGRTVTTTLDQDGDGQTDQIESVVVDGAGVSITTTQEFSVNGTLLKQVEVEISADGLNRVISSDMNGDGIFESVDSVDTTINSNGSETRVSEHRSANGTLLSGEIRNVSADRKSTMILTDADGNGSAEVNEETVTSIGVDGMITTAVRARGSDTTLIGGTVSTASSDGLARSIASDLDGDDVADRSTNEISVVVSGTTTTTQEIRSGDNSLLSKKATASAQDGSLSVQLDADGDGYFESTSQKEVDSNGAASLTEQARSANGTLVRSSITTTSADGLTINQSIDEDGDGDADSIVSRVTVINANGSATETRTVFRGSGSNLVGQTVTTTSADSLSQSAQVDLNGDGITDQSTYFEIELDVSGNRIQTLSRRTATGAEFERTTTTLSADRKTETIITDSNGDGNADLTVVQATAANGSVSVMESETSDDGLLHYRKTTATSADGLSISTSEDLNGDGVADAASSSITILNSDGSRTTTASVASGNGTLLSRTVSTISGNGLATDAATDVDGDGDVDRKLSEVTVLNGNGSRTRTVSETTGGDILIKRTTTTVSGNGLVSTVASDLDGDGSSDYVATSTREYLADGSITDTVDLESASGLLLSQTVVETAADGKLQTTTIDLDGDGSVDRRVTDEVLSNGTRRVTVEHFEGAGISSRSISSTSANGLSKEFKADLDGDDQFDDRPVVTEITTLNADGSTIVVAEERTSTGTLVERIAAVTSANGFQKTTTWSNASGAVRTRTETSSIGSDSVLTVTTVQRNASSAIERSWTTTRSADGRTNTFMLDEDGDGISDKQETSSIANDGSLVTTSTELGANGVATAAKKIVTLSADGLSQTTDYDTNGDGTIDVRELISTVLDANGGTTTTNSRYVRGTSGLELAGQSSKVVSGNGLSGSVSWDINGDGSTDRSKTDVTVLNSDGSRTRTVVTNNDSSNQSQVQSTTSASERSVSTIRTGSDGQGSYSQTSAETTEIAADGKKVRTVSHIRTGGSLLSNIVETTSADGRVVTIAEQREGFADRVITRTTDKLADGSTREVVATTSSSGTPLSRVVSISSANGKRVSIERDTNGDGLLEEIEELEPVAGGGSKTTIRGFTSGGAVNRITTIRVSEDGLTTTTEWDNSGNGTIDRRRTTVTKPQADGRYTVVSTDTTGSGTLLAKSTTDASADGRTTIVSRDLNGDGTNDRIETTVVDQSGASVTTITNNAEGRKEKYLSAADVRWNDVPAAKIEISVAADGFSRTTRSDFDGNGTFEHVAQTRVNADGSLYTSVVETNADGSTKSTGTISRSADGLTTVLKKFAGSSTTLQQVQTSLIMVDGSATLTTQSYGTTGSLTQTTIDTIGATGSLLRRDVMNASNQLLSRLVVDSETEASVLTSYIAASGAVSSVYNMDKNGIVVSGILYDPTNANSWTRVEQTYANGKKTLEKQFMDNGQRVEITFDAATGKQTKSTTFDSANRTLAVENYTNGVIANATLYDPANMNSWTRVEQTYTGGKKTLEKQFMDNGTRIEITFDPTDAQNWIKNENHYNTTGGRTFQKIYYDDGTSREITYDPTSAQSWTYVQNDFNSAAQRTLQFVQYDNGTRARIYYDPTGVQPWIRSERSYNSADQLTLMTNFMDDGTKVQTSYDPTNAQTWTIVQKTYNSAGQQTLQLVDYDNGAQTRIYYDPTDVQPWTRSERTYNSSDQMTLMTNFIDDGTKVQTVYDLPSTQSWYYQQSTYSSAGALTQLDIKADSGTWTRSMYYQGSVTVIYYYNASNQLIRTEYPNGVPGGGGGSHGQPVLLDLNGDDHIDLRPFDETEFLAGEGPLFDWNGDGIGDGTAWVGAQDGFLAIDLAADGSSGPDGAIDQAKEIAFAQWVDESMLPEGIEEVTDLEGLRMVFDTNQDNVLDENDARWSEFRVWQDANQNGITDQGELRTMAEAGIKLISLIPSLENPQGFADGSVISGTSFMEMTDGSTRQLVGDATLAYRVSEPATV